MLCIWNEFIHEKEGMKKKNALRKFILTESMALLPKCSVVTTSIGYSESISLVYVDFETQKCTIKDSGYRYRRVIESNG